MPMSKHREIRDAIKARLALLAGGNVQAGRAWPMAEQDASLVKVYLDTSQRTAEMIQGEPDAWNTRIRCEFHARGTVADPAEDLADGLAVQAFALVMAEPSLGGLCMDCNALGIGWATDEAETSIAVAQIVFDVLHRTVFNSIAA